MLFRMTKNTPFTVNTNRTDPYKSYRFAEAPEEAEKDTKTKKAVKKTAKKKSVKK
jgi:hypothetical protein